jgi:hypothetical protein
MARGPIRVTESRIEQTDRLSGRAARAVRPKLTPPMIASLFSSRSIDIPVP